MVVNLIDSDENRWFHLWTINKCERRTMSKIIRKISEGQNERKTTENSLFDDRILVEPFDSVEFDRSNLPKSTVSVFFVAKTVVKRKKINRIGRRWVRESSEHSKISRNHRQDRTKIRIVSISLFFQRSIRRKKAKAICLFFFLQRRFFFSGYVALVWFLRRSFSIFFSFVLTRRCFFSVHTTRKQMLERLNTID